MPNYHLTTKEDREFLKKRYQRSRLKQKYCQYKQTCKLNNRQFELTLQEFEELIFGPCHYCGSAWIKLNGIDRIDNNEDYLIGNVVSCCFKCNKMKSAYSVEEFLTHIKKIHEFQLTKNALPN